jgi:hypothetical protein
MDVVCCGAAQLLRGRKRDVSARVEQKLERAKAATLAGAAGGGGAHDGRGCDAPACSKREAFEGAFKMCGKCFAVRYCCAVCQARTRARLPAALGSSPAANHNTPASAADVPRLPAAPQKTHWKQHKRSCAPK